MSHNVTVKGFLTEDAAVNTVNAQRDALNFTVASTRRWPDGNGGTNEKTEFFECVMFRARGQFNAILSKGRFVKGTEVKVNRAYMETSKNVVGEKTYNNVQFVVDGFRNANAPSLEILTTKAERDFLKLAKEKGQFVQPASQAPAQQTPAQQTPAQQTPVHQTPVQQAPVQTKEPAQAMPQYNEPPMDFDDDIPF